MGNEAKTWLKMAFLLDSKEIKLILHKHLLSIYSVTGIVLKHVSKWVVLGLEVHKVWCPWAGSISTMTWELVTNAYSQEPPQT